MLELENIKYHNTLILYPELFAISRVIYFLDDKENIDPHHIIIAIKEFSDNNPTFRTHGFFDIFEAISDFLTSAHLNLITPDRPHKILGYELSTPTSKMKKKQVSNTYVYTESNEELIRVSQTSPFFTSISGSIDTEMKCEVCGKEDIKKDAFMSLNFKLLGSDNVKQIRKRFEDEGYTEGLVTKGSKSKKIWNIMSIMNIFGKKNTNEPILTIRDYLCYLNLVQTHKIVRHCDVCQKDSEHLVSKLLNRSPEILIIGFFEGENEHTSSLDYRIDIEFDISPFVNQPLPKYELCTVVNSEIGILGIRNDVTYMRGSNNVWMRIDTFGISQVDSNVLYSINRPTLLIYQKSLVYDQEMKNVESSFDLRDQFEGVELSPLPCFYMEELKLLGIKLPIDLQVFLCKHDMFQPSYRDIYGYTIDNRYININDNEINIIEKKRAIKPERKYIQSSSYILKRLMIGTTMLPTPIVDYILEKVDIDNTIDER